MVKKTPRQLVLLWTGLMLLCIKPIQADSFYGQKGTTSREEYQIQESWGNYSPDNYSAGKTPSSGYYPRVEYPPLMQEYGSNPYYDNRANWHYPSQPAPFPNQKQQDKYPKRSPGYHFPNYRPYYYPYYFPY